MDNKLEQLTQKLYEEGLVKGRSEGERLIAEAQTRSRGIVAEAEEQAREIARKATRDAEDLRKNTLTEVALAGRQAVAKIKDEIADLVVARAVSDGVKSAGVDAGFVKEMLLAVARNWNGASSGKVALEALLPADKQKHFEEAFAASVSELLKAGIEVGYSRDVRSGFKIGEKGGGYYIGFSDENFEALLGQYLREKVSKILFAEKK